MKLKLELLSDAVPGSGEGLAGVIDTEIAQDECGLPYIPGKRIKGILRESAKELKDIGEIKSDIKAIFGKEGEKWGSDFKISDGYLENYEGLRNFLTYCSMDSELKQIFNRQAVLDFFTYTRTQTAIERETEVAEEKSLRTLRVLKKGLNFYFDVHCKDEYIEDLEKICKVTRNFGLRRTRGLGEIKFELLDEEKRGSEEVHEKSEKVNGLYELPIFIENLSELLLYTRVGRSQISDTFISGSFILGAFALAYISKHNLENAHENEDFYHLFLSGKVKFLNAYPTNIDGDKFYSTPASIAKEKDKEEYFNLKRPDKQIERPGFEYVKLNDEIEYISVGRKIEYHHARPEDRTIGHPTEKKREFFQFEVIDKGQKFLGKIIGGRAELEILKSIIPNNSNNSIIYLGKSKTAQYGKCRIVYGEIEDASQGKITWESGERITVRLVSDMILINECGFIVPDIKILKDEIALWLGIDKDKIEVENAFLRFKKVSGFSSIWGLPKIQANALKAGSVIVLKNNSNRNIEVPSFHAFGIRTEEGYGQVVFEEYLEKEFNNVKHTSEEVSCPSDLSFYAELIEFVLLKHLKRRLKDEALNKVPEKFKVPNAFIGKMVSFIQKSDNFNELNNKINKLKDRASKHLEKIAEFLYIKDKKVNKTQFEKNVEQKLVLRKSDILKKAKIFEGFYRSELYLLYKDYALTFLNALRLINR